MSRDEWKIILSKASANINAEICANVSHNIIPPKEKLIVQELINQICEAL
jgi:hypothetical protein